MTSPRSDHLREVLGAIRTEASAKRRSREALGRMLTACNVLAEDGLRRDERLSVGSEDPGTVRLRDALAFIAQETYGRDSLDAFPRSREENARRLGNCRLMASVALAAEGSSAPDLARTA